MVLERTVPDGCSKRLSSFLASDMKLSSSMVRRLKRVQGIFVDGVPQYTSYILRGGETVTVDIGLAEVESDIVPQDGEVDIIFENEGILALNKPNGMLTHPSRAQYTDTLANFAAGYLTDGVCHAVNRLDRGTSGVVLFAKSSYHMERCVDALRREDARKTYTAVVYGEVSPRDGTIDLPISRPDERDIKRIVSADGQRAVTHYKTLRVASLDGVTVSVLSLVLETGRTHQIRVHLSSLGHPVLGDRLYASEETARLNEKYGLRDQLLHASELRFTDPVSGEFLALQAEITRQDMKDILEMLK